MPPYYYSTRQPQPSKPLQPQRNRRSFGRQVLIACIFGIVGVLTVQVVSRAIAAYTAPKPHVDARLQTALNSWVSQQPFRSTVFVSELSGDLRTAAYGSADQMVTASTYKFYVAYATLHQVEQGSISMNTRTQTGQTVTSALSKMILQSDNSSAEALGFLVGWNNIDTLVTSAGALHTHINNYDSSGNATQGDKRSTAGDLGLILGKLQDGKLLDAGDT